MDPPSPQQQQLQLPKVSVGRKETSESVTSADELEGFVDDPSLLLLRPRPSTTLNLTGAIIRDSSYPGEAGDDAGACFFLVSLLSDSCLGRGEGSHHPQPDGG